MQSKKPPCGNLYSILIKMTQELLTVADVKFKFVNVTENMEADIKKAVEHQLANKGQTILKKIYANNVDAKVIVEYTIERNKNWLYEADFIFNFGGEKFVVENHKGFKIATDLVAHAFDKRKRRVLGFWGALFSR